MLNLFYEEPDLDRWIAGDRYPRALIRRIVRGKPRPGGHKRVFLNLCAGLERLGVQFQVNDYPFARKNPDALACIVGKPYVLSKMEWRNPILLGPSIYSHPIDDPDLFERLPVKRVLVPCTWMKEMFNPMWGDRVQIWPVGIATDLWAPPDGAKKKTDILLYDKVLWDHDDREISLIEPIRAFLRTQGISFVDVRYGFYREEAFREQLERCRAMIFLCEHETQGIAYQQALSCGVPIFAWDSGGYWLDPSYYPDRVKFGPVTSVPYWDERCGSKFANLGQFLGTWDEFWDGILASRYQPREYILENLTLEKCAQAYVDIANSIS